MISRQRLLFFCLLFVATFSASAFDARADSITSNTIVVVQGTFAAGTSDNIPAGTFNFLLPLGHTITAASLVGSAQYNLQVGAQIGLVLDGNLLTNISGVSASSPINIALNPATFSTLADGTTTFSLNRTGGTFGGGYNLFSLQLQITTAPGAPTAPVPEPATLMLLGTGVVSFAAWKRRKSAKR